MPTLNHALENKQEGVLDMQLVSSISTDLLGLPDVAPTPATHAAASLNADESIQQVKVAGLNLKELDSTQVSGADVVGVGIRLLDVRELVVVVW